MYKKELAILKAEGLKDKYEGEELRQKTLSVLSCIPEEYLALSFKDFPGVETGLTDKLKDFIQSYVDNLYTDKKFDKGLMFFGPTGCGKTFLASYVMQHIMWSKFPEFTSNAFVTMNDIVVAYNAENKHENRDANFKHEDFNKGVLCIDDLGKEYAMTWKGIDTDKEAWGLVLENILKNRCEKSLPTLLTSNLNIPSVERLYGDGCADAMATCMRTVRLTGLKNWRQEKNDDEAFEV